MIACAHVALTPTCRRDALRFGVGAALASYVPTLQAAIAFDKQSQIMQSMQTSPNGGTPPSDLGVAKRVVREDFDDITFSGLRGCDGKPVASARLAMCFSKTEFSPASTR